MNIKSILKEYPQMSEYNVWICPTAANEYPELVGLAGEVDEKFLDKEIKVIDNINKIITIQLIQE